MWDCGAREVLSSIRIDNQPAIIKMQIIYLDMWISKRKQRMMARTCILASGFDWLRDQSANLPTTPKVLGLMQAPRTDELDKLYSKSQQGMKAKPRSFELTCNLTQMEVVIWHARDGKFDLEKVF